MQKREINKIIIHCTDTPDSMDIGIKEIDIWHQQQLFDVSSLGHFTGYHYVIRRDGAIETARLEHEAGVHCKGQNKSSIGIAYVGRKINAPQRAALYNLIISILLKYGLEPKQVFGHCEFNKLKTCPNLGDLDAIRDDIEVLYQHGGNE